MFSNPLSRSTIRSTSCDSRAVTARLKPCLRTPAQRPDPTGFSARVERNRLLGAIEGDWLPSDPATESRASHSDLLAERKDLIEKRWMTARSSPITQLRSTRVAEGGHHRSLPEYQHRRRPLWTLWSSSEFLRLLSSNHCILFVLFCFSFINKKLTCTYTGPLASITEFLA
ncbi:hypothetical protein BY996DRAFT_1677027 [Phakopsora pachyrhizi]|nr:hypothetical protein BY996DRAFT_1677027 [Phakopsora pachyrhizi]